MKKVLFLIATFCLIFQSSFGQAVSSYTFTAIQGNYISLTGVAGVVDTSLATTADTGVSTSITLPFAVTFAGTVYSSIQVSPNGWLSFGTPIVTDAQNSTNSVANAGVVKPVLFPLWDDLKCTVKPRYITTGIYPHRRFKVEWSQQKWDAQSSGDTVSFQVWFFETTNVIEYLYSQGVTAVSNSSGGASIGMCDANGNYLALNNSGASPSADYTIFTDNISTKPASGQIYRFTPPSTAGLVASKYCFTASAATYGILTGTSPVGGIGAVDDDGITNPIILDFPFSFAGTTYTNVIVSPNGWLTFGLPTITNAQNAANSATNAALLKPVLMPLWDDLKCTEKIRYVTVDAAPNRIFKIEWYHQKWDHTANGDVISFQIWLYEGTNIIEYYYNQEPTAVKAPSATIGIYDANGNYLTLNNSGASPTAQSGTFTTNIATRPASGQVYQFKPPPTISYPGNAYIAIGKVAVTQTGATGGTYSATPPGLSLNSSTGEVNLAASAGGTFTIVYTVSGCSNASAVMTIFPLLPVPTATVTAVSCAAATDGAITITNMNNALKFIRADNDYIDLGSPLLSNKSAFTIEGWIKFNIADVTARMSLFGQNDAIEFGFANSTTIELSTPATGPVTATLPASLGDGSWHHIAAVGNGSTVKIYLNGVSVTVTGGVVNTANYGSSSNNTKIGSGVYNATGDSFTGQVAKLGLYSTALSASGIAALAFGPTTYSGYETGIIAGYNIAIGSGTTLYSYPAGNNGTFQNSPEWIDPYTYYWQKIGNAGFSATTKNLTGLSPGDYTVTVSLIGVSSPNATSFTVGSASVVTALEGTGASCSNSFTARWTASTGTISYSLDAATDSDFTNFVSGFNNLNVGNVTSYAVTGLPPGNIYYRVRKNSSCGVSANSNVITYATLQINSPTATAATNLSCSGFNANWNAVSNATAYYLDVSTDPAFSTFVSGYNGLYVGNVTSISVISLASGFSYYYRVRSSNAACGTVVTPSNVVQVDIDSAPTAPLVGVIEQISCARRGGSVALSGLPAGDWILNFSSGDTYSGSGTTVTIPGLASGNYTVTVSEGGCFSVNSANISIAISPISETSWDGATWSNGLPSLTKRVVFNGGTLFTVSGNMDMCSCQINSGSVIVNSEIVLFIEGALDINSSTSLTFENNASLVQGSDTAVNSGNIIYKRTTSAVKDFDYVYWSSPVEDQTLGLLSPSSSKYWSFADGAWVAETASSIMTKGKGFIARVPNYVTSQNVEFIGVPYNGPISIVAQGTGKANLIGNPYASAINADSFITLNSAIVGGALYFWTHSTPRKLSGTNFVYTTNDYATYNFTGGVATAYAAKSTDTNGDGIGDGTAPSGKIGAGQSFFIISKNAGSFTFNNSMRISASGNNSQFFKQATIKKTEAIEKNRVWLNLTNDGGAFKQLLVGYVTGATNGFDTLFDGTTLDGNVYIDFYSVNNSKKYTIQGRALPFDTADEVPLGYRTTIAGIFQISIDNTDGALTNQAVYLEDKLTNTIHNLKNGTYSFSTAIGTFTDRFVLRYTNSSLSTDDFIEDSDKGVIVSQKNRQIKINSLKQMIAAVKIYDLKGSLLYQKDKVNDKEFIINQLQSNTQVLIVKTQLEDGKWVSEKVIFHE